ncbi:MAG: protein kinase [Micromonosporaceae bacterium]|nr:protein kinase [Micromonosporaceae bacterium]
MTQVGEGRGAEYGVGAPAGGEVLAERYQLEQHVNSDSAGRQIWRGVDVILRRQVAIVIRYPGGPAAAQMLQTAVEASRIVHPNLVGVYDAIDEHHRAYVVREWVDGASLRDHVAMGPFDGTRAVAVAHAVAAGATAVHSTGMSHGNIHPGTVLIGLDGRVVLADPRADGTAPVEEDVRGVGALLYFALTGYWPHAEVAGPTSLPDAMRDRTGALATPRQVRAGIPDHLDNLTMDLLDRRLPVPATEVLTGELARLDAQPELAYDPGGPGYPGGSGYADPGYPAAGGYPDPDRSSTGPIRFSRDPTTATPKPSGRKIALGLSGLLVAGVVGLLVGLNWLTGSPDPDEGGPSGIAGNPTTAPQPSVEPTGQPGPLALTADQVRVVDPPDGNRAELADVELVVDDDLSTGWRSDRYNSADWGSIKPGMGILINLGEPRQVSAVRVELATGGATADLRVGDQDPGDNRAGDDQIYQTYQPLGDPVSGGTTIVFSAFEPDQTYQYLMVWFSELAPDPENAGKFGVEVQQIAVEGY